MRDRSIFVEDYTECDTSSAATETAEEIEQHIQKKKKKRLR